MKSLILFSSLLSIAFIIIIFAIVVNSALSWIILGLSGVILPVWYECIKGYISDKNNNED